MTRPDPDECAAFYQKYIDELPDQPILTLLEKQLLETRQLMQTLDDEQATFRYAPGKWSIKQMLGHLTDTERVFCYRAMCFARNDPGPLPTMDENTYVANAHFDNRALASLLEEYEHVRKASIVFFASLTDEICTRRGVANDCEFTVRVLPYIIAGHERHHLNVLHERYLSKLNLL